MDAPSWSNCDEENIIKSNVEGRCTRSNKGNAMQAEELDQGDIGAGLIQLDTISNEEDIGGSRDLRPEEQL